MTRPLHITEYLKNLAIKQYEVSLHYNGSTGKSTYMYKGNNYTKSEIDKMFPTHVASTLAFGNQHVKAFKGANCDGSKNWMQ